MRTPLFLQSIETTFLILEILQTIGIAICCIVLVWCGLTYFLEPFMEMVKAKKQSHTKRFEQQTVERLNKNDAEIEDIKRTINDQKL